MNSPLPPNGIVAGPADDQWQLCVDPALRPFVLRALAGRTALDAEIDAMPLPRGGIWLRRLVGLLRTYRRLRPESLGRRCVCDPSCSRYAELALRRHGLRRGLLRTLERLGRCRPGHGGVDLP